MLFTKNNISSTLILIAFLCSPLNAIAMGQTARTAVHWAISAGPLMLSSVAITCFKETTQDLLKKTKNDAPKPVQELYTNIFKQHNAENPDKPLSVKTASKIHEPTGMLFDGIVQVSETDTQEITSLYEKLQCRHKETLHQNCSCPESIAIQKILNKHRFIAFHEATHEKEKHILRLNTFNFFLPIITHAGFTALKATKNPPTIKGGIAKLCTSLLLSHLCEIYMEHRADNGVPNQKALLQAGADIYKDTHTLEHKRVATAFATSFPSWSKETVEKRATIFAKINRLLDVHPNPSTREKTLQKRADQAEQ